MGDWPDRQTSIIKILYFPFKNYHFLQELYKVKIYKICDSLIQLHHLQALVLY